jgi:dolichol-phosphate mannosyltransferase
MVGNSRKGKRAAMLISASKSIVRFSSISSANPITLKNTTKLSLIIPTYNEGKNISELVKRIENSLNHIPFEIIIVDDNSPDGTGKIAQALNSKYGNIKILTRSGKLGLSSAVLEGFKKADSSVLSVIDADMQHPPEILAKMYDKIREGHDLVVASRYIDGGGAENWKLHRILLSRGATMIAHLLLPGTRKIKDVMSGCFMFRNEALDHTNLSPIGFKILLEIMAKSEFDNVAEVPYIFGNRRNGKSNLSVKEMQNYIMHVLQIFCFSPSASRNNVPISRTPNSQYELSLSIRKNKTYE